MTAGARPAARSLGRGAGRMLALEPPAGVRPAGSGGWRVGGPSPPAPSQCPGPLTGVALSVAGWTPREQSEAVGPSPGDGLGQFGEHAGSGVHAGASTTDVAAPCSAPPWAPRGQVGLDAGGFSRSVLTLRDCCLSRGWCCDAAEPRCTPPPGLRGRGRRGSTSGAAQGHCASAQPLQKPSRASPRLPCNWTCASWNCPRLLCPPRPFGDHQIVLSVLSLILFRLFCFRECCLP